MATTTERWKSVAMSMVTGSFAGISASMFTTPIELVKNRLQLQGELGAQARPYGNPLSAFFTIARADGIRNLYRGIGPALSYQLVMNGIRLGLYDSTLAFYQQAVPVGWLQGSSALDFLVRVWAGATSGMLGAFMGSPLFLIKTRMQVQSSIRGVGSHYNYKSGRDGFVRIYREEGVRGLYRGAFAAVLRVAAGGSVQLATYEQSKDLLMQIAPALVSQSRLTHHFLASMISGVAVTFAMNPFDLVSTRLYNQGSLGGSTHYSGWTDCVIKTVRAEGILSLWKGSLAHYMRVGPHTVLTLMFLEQYRAFFASSLDLRANSPSENRASRSAGK